MSGDNLKFMRDVFIEHLYEKMKKNEKIFFLSGDFGAPMLDKLRNDFSERFINVGVAEQNLINIATGLALEGFVVYAYGIAPFLTMRAFEQIRINLGILSQLRKINVNLIGVGAGLSYDVSGPTHHCLEDIGIMRMLPNISVFSPSDWVLTKKFVDYSIKNKNPKYIRLDGKRLAQIYDENQNIKIENGFSELMKGDNACIVSTGYMTHTAIRTAGLLREDGIKIGVIDVFLLRPLDEKLLFKALNKYKFVITLEEAFINKGGLDSLIASILNKNNSSIKLSSFGFSDSYIFEIGNREYLHKLNKLDDVSIAGDIIKIVG